jgi:hypothetical protein
VSAHLLIRGYYTSFNERRFADAAELFAKDGLLEHPPFGTVRQGGEGYIQFAEMWVKAFPDVQIRIEHVEQRGDTICEVDLAGTGTHLGDFDMGGYGLFRAKGVVTTIRCRELLEIRGGKITYSGLTLDAHDLIRQLSGKA